MDSSDEGSVANGGSVRIGTEDDSSSGGDDNDF
jgi:hypothetical protein